MASINNITTGPNHHQIHYHSHNSSVIIEKKSVIRPKNSKLWLLVDGNAGLDSDWSQLPGWVSRALQEGQPIQDICTSATAICWLVQVDEPNDLQKQYKNRRAIYIYIGLAAGNPYITWDLRLFGCWQKWNVFRIPPHGGEKWWFTMVESKRSP